MPTAIDVFSKARGHERAEQLQRRPRGGPAAVLPHARVARRRPVVEMEGAERIMLGSNNYLGLTARPARHGRARATRSSATAPA